MENTNEAHRLKKAVVLGGQTASGKTSLAVDICQAFGGEIISADSMQVYRGMDIGTAKPTAEERARAPHHLIDIIDIGEEYSAAAFIAHASAAMTDIEARGKLPVITGGTGLYQTMLFDSFSLRDDRNESLRKQLTDSAALDGGAALYAELAAVDPEAAMTVHPGNVRRVIRYLEIYRTTGITPSEMNRLNNSGEKRYEPLYICLFSADRQLIYSRINARVDEMLACGLEAEVRAACDAGLASAPTASAAIGYKEFFPYFRGETTLEQTVEDIKQHSRNYAKRQHTFFKRIKGAVFLDIADPDYRERATALVRDYLTDD